MMSRRSARFGARTLLLVTALLGVAGAAGPARAAAETGRTVDFALTLSQTATDSPTGLGLHIRFKDPNSDTAKPSPIRAVVISGPPGLRFDTSAAPRCSASDAQIQAQGTGACPADSQVALGSFTAVTGFGPPADPFLGDDHVFNGDEQLIEIVTAPGTPVSPGLDRLSISGSTLTAHPPKTPGGPPDGETAPRSIDFQIPVHATQGRSLITTPPACPPAGVWQSSGSFTFANGQSETVVSSTPCTAPGAQNAAGNGQAPGRGIPGCMSRRRLTIRVPRARGARIRRVELVIDGKRVRQFPPRTRRVAVDLRGTPKRPVHVRVVAITVGGRRLSSSHTLHTCTPRAQR
jgi:hypothetical protein